MKHPVKTLAALAFLGVMAPTAHAVSIKDDVLSLTPGVRIQTRAQMNDATTGTAATTAAGITSNNGPGTDFRVASGTPGATDDAIDFMLRRARIYMNFKYGSNWKGQIAIHADGVDNSATNANRGMNLRYAWLERGFDMGDGISHGITFGLNKPYNNATDSAMSSSREMMPNSFASASYLAPRGVGAGYRFYHPVFMIAADLQNNTNGTKDTTPDTSATSFNNGDEKEGFFYGVRAEFSLSPDWFIKKRSESFVGKEGQGLNIGLSYGMNQDAVLADVDASGATAPGKRNLSAYGIDALFWLNGISAFAEYRTGTQESERNDGISTAASAANTGTADVDAEFISFQIGYAMPLGEEVIEPCIRYQIIDNNTDADETVNYSTAAQGSTATDSGQSGTQIDFGVNYYLNGHDHKLHLAVSLWESEEGQGDATIVRLQHQINF